MVGVRAQGNLPRIVKTKAAANRNGNAARSAFREASQRGRTGNHVGGASGGKNAMATSGNHIFQCLFEIGCCIKGAVKGDLRGDQPVARVRGYAQYRRRRWGEVRRARHRPRQHYEWFESHRA